MFPLPTLGCLLVLTCSHALLNISEEYPTAIKFDQKDDVTDGDFSYEDQDNWGGICQTGDAQSPIYLNEETVVNMDVPRVRFNYYNGTLQMPLVLSNNGHTASLEITPTQLGPRAYITGALLPGEFEAQSVHFHWGDRYSGGAEHVIASMRTEADAEMHIVHKNKRYATASEASMHPDGLAVLAVLISSVRVPTPMETGLIKIFNRLPRIVRYNSRTTITERFQVDELLENVSRGRFFTYNGSLTTPDCAEAVTWIVFRDAIALNYRLIERLWNLRDSRSMRIVNNYRALQSRNGRPVYYRNLRGLKNIL
ncbi:carbonic anhydrase 14 [Drosophila obscura]|uniref:carbonic anhydrase 14 n=1 Tax=Drosophila obscura TaxID=7282 RepID=UPI001BB11EBA|nr:carbonic anhydrase 14 [Drosophila obscura]